MPVDSGNAKLKHLSKPEKLLPGDLGGTGAPPAASSSRANAILHLKDGMAGVIDPPRKKEIGNS